MHSRTAAKTTDPAGNADPARPFAGEAFSAHIDSQLTEERATKSSLEARGAALITSSGAFVTLLAAGFALAFGQNPEAVPDPSRWFVMAAVVALLTASVAGVLANKPADYGETDADDMAVWLRDHWRSDAVAAAHRTAEAQLATLRTARARNADKATLVKTGAWAQAAAVLLLVGATGGLVGLI